MKIKVLNTETQIEIREMNLDDWVDQTGECSLGRSPYSGLVLDSPDVSRLHAKFAFESGQYYFYDLGSSNGSMINGRVVDSQQKQLLKPGDIIRVGEFMLTLYPVNEQSEIPATVIGGSEMTVCGQLSMPELIDVQPSLEAEPSNLSQAELQAELSESEVKALSQIEKSLSLETSPEVAAPIDSLTGDELIDNESGNEFDNDSSSELDHPSLDDPSFKLNADDFADPESPESDFTMIQLDESVDLSESATSDEAMVLLPEIEEAVEQIDGESFEENSNSPVSNSFSTDSISVEEPTFIQLNELSEAEANSSEPMPHSGVDSDETSEPEQLLNPIETLEPTEVTSNIEPDLFTEHSFGSGDVISLEESITPTDAVLFPESSTHLSAESNYQTEADGSIESPSIQPDDLDQSNENHEIELEVELESVHTAEPSLDTEIPPSEVSDDEIEIAVASSWNNVDDVEELELETSDVTTPDTPIPAPIEHQPVLSEKYVALLAHDSQTTALAELVANHKEFLTYCLTIATPSVSEALKQQTGFEVSHQTPAVPIGGYQTINSLITADKIAAVIFLRDFLSAHVNQVNDEAFSRSCNIHQVLFASNFPTAGALMHHLQNAVIKQ